ncbi:hypothetical protein QF001_000091 [Paraburkholderia youngii]
MNGVVAENELFRPDYVGYRSACQTHLSWESSC